MQRPIVLTVAGFDPCGGAGVLADIKTLEQLQVQGIAVLTAETLQTEQEFFKLTWRKTAVITEEIEQLMRSYSVAAVKIGIVQNAAVLQAIVTVIRQFNPQVFVLWDPVIRSSSGCDFFVLNDEDQLKSALKNIDLVTPNEQEFQALRGYFSAEQTVLRKGGHRQELKNCDLLLQKNKETIFKPSKGKMYAKHGSGCVLSSAIAAQVAKGETLISACSKAKKYVEHYLQSSASLIGFHHYAIS